SSDSKQTIYYVLRSHYFFSFFLFYASPDPRNPHSFPTRRSSDLGSSRRRIAARSSRCAGGRASRCSCNAASRFVCWSSRPQTKRDRKSTRLNSSHVAISYAVFCLKKKKKSSGGCRSAGGW